MVSVYNYYDYRRFLKDRFAEAKARNPRFSIRVFNRLSGIQSTSFLKNVIDGKRNLADSGISRIAKGFGLNSQERSFFTALVKFNQASEHDEKNHHFQEMSRHRQFLKAKGMDAGQYRMYTQWYYVAILELVRLGEATPKDLAWIQKHLIQSLDWKSLKNAVRDLTQIGLLEEVRQGSSIGFVRKDAMLSTSDAVQSLGITNFHVIMSEMAAKSVARDEGKDREFSALTIALSDEGFQRAKLAIREFRKTLHSILEQDQKGPNDQETKNSVAQINLQLFKLGKL